MVRGFAVVAMIGACAWVATAANAQCPTPGTVGAVCSPEASCARIAVGNASGSSSAAGAVSITFNQGPDDSQAQRGHDDVAAIAFTLGIPGTGSDAPLMFDCVDGNLADGAVTPGAAIADNFTVVVENAQCTGRNRCLCPDTGAGQERDNFVNIAIYGPKSLPEQGPVSIPKLPASGEIVKLNLKAASPTPGTVPMHVFSALDASKPQFAANLSIGDQSACDVSADAGKSTVLFADGTFTITGGGVTCVGDCSGDHTVTINELITGVNIALGSANVSACQSFDVNGDGSVAINELIGGVNAALNGCPS
ncbi:MAG TPA: hypothetical protein VL049_07825 [Candidatus Dormibacteraeota bacterium]|nr:hypothetical protein [Candidatus Dormibacteraeota bacterium]